MSAAACASPAADGSPRGPPEKGLPPGHQTLIVDGLVSKDHRRRLGDRIEIPFFVDRLQGKGLRHRPRREPRRACASSDSRHRTLARRPQAGWPLHRDHESRATARRARPYASRSTSRAAGSIRTPSSSGSQKNRARRFGKLARIAARPRAEDRARPHGFPIAIWLHGEDPLDPAEKKERGETKRPTRQSAGSRSKAIAKVAHDFTRASSGNIASAATATDPSAPVVYASLTREQVRRSPARPEVAGLFLHETTGIDDLTDSIAIANSDDVHTLGFRGSGVKVAIWENAPDVTTNLSITARYKTSGLTTSDHSRHTHGIVKNIEANKPHGHAPSCSLHSANTKDLDAVRWAAKDKGCTVISQSFHRDSEPESGSMSFDDIYKDWLALQWPYPTICQAAGNYWKGDPDDIDPPESEYVNHKGYNSLGVGNHNDTASAMSGDSVFRNPISRRTATASCPRSRRTAPASRPSA